MNVPSTPDLDAIQAGSTTAIIGVAAVLAVVGICLILIALYVEIKREKRMLTTDLAREIGRSLVVAFAVVITVELFMAKRQEAALSFIESTVQASVNTIKAESFDAALRNFVGSDVQEAINEQIIDQKIHYDELRVVANWDMADPNDLNAGVKGHIEQRIYLRNTSSDYLPHEIRKKLTDLKGDLRFQRISLYTVNGNRIPIGEPILDLGPQEIESRIARGGSNAEFVYQAELEPGGYYYLNYVFDVVDVSKGYYNLQTRYTCSKMILEFDFPDDLKPSWHVMHPGGVDVLDNLDEQRNMLDVTVRSALLPLQGIYVTWRPLREGS